jgi:2-keto-4-pentenoate hydratase/2-oxohepta-3-ene-1,7-dioic acid hydratase in catechol pathway
MRFGTIDDRFVLVDGERALDVERASGGTLPADPLLALARWDDVQTWAATADFTDATPISTLGPPVPHPRQVFAIALNYRPHAAEAGYEPPVAPLVFTKFPSCIAGPDIEVRLPEGKVDWEIEIVAVIGRGGRDIPREEAWNAVAGLTVGQDLSERVLQLTGKPSPASGRSGRWPSPPTSSPTATTSASYPHSTVSASSTAAAPK